MSSNIRSFMLLASFVIVVSSFWFCKSKENDSLPTVEVQKSGLTTYALTQFYKAQTMALVKSNEASTNEQAQNLDFLTTLDAAHNRLVNSFYHSSKCNCGDDKSPQDCIGILTEPGCHTCAEGICCDEGIANPLGSHLNPYRVVALKEMNPHFYFESTELQLPFTLSNGVQVFTFSKDKRVDKIVSDFDGKQHEILLK
jgi:hypothetical protein